MLVLSERRMIELGATRGLTMRKSLLSIVVAASAIIALSNSPALAFHGCVQSPENPSVILGLLGGAAAMLPLLRGRLKSRRADKSEGGRSV